MKKFEDMSKLTLEILKERFPNTHPEYLENIAEHLPKEDWDILDGVKDKPDYIEARKRLEILSLEKYDQPYEFKTYVNKENKSNKTKTIDKPDEIDFKRLNTCIDDLLGYTNENGKFVLGGLAQTYLKTDGLKEMPETEKSNVNFMELSKEEQEELKIKKKEIKKVKNKIKSHNRKLREKEAYKVYNDTYKDLIDSVRDGTAKVEEAKYLIEQLRVEHIEMEDKAKKRVYDAYKSIPNEELLPGEVNVQIWGRDPSKDLSCSNGEFFACAFLGGINDWGSAKYVRNGALSMIDFSIMYKGEEERFARAITGATVERDENGLTGKTYMLVDSVEGSDKIKTKITLEPIIEYARHCGFDGVVFNTDGDMNDYPLEVIKTIDKIVEREGEKSIFKDEKRNLQLVYSNGAEYFESFGGEGGIIGEVDGYVVDFKDKVNQND